MFWSHSITNPKLEIISRIPLWTGKTVETNRNLACEGYLNRKWMQLYVVRKTNYLKPISDQGSGWLDEFLFVEYTHRRLATPNPMPLVFVIYRLECHFIKTYGKTWEILFGWARMRNALQWKYDVLIYWQEMQLDLHHGRKIMKVNFNSKDRMVCDNEMETFPYSIKPIHSSFVTPSLVAKSTGIERAQTFPQILQFTEAYHFYILYLMSHTSSNQSSVWVAKFAFFRMPLVVP